MWPKIGQPSATVTDSVGNSYPDLSRNFQFDCKKTSVDKLCRIKVSIS